ncbi:unnamed protein product [Prunus armeniaca]|uniref:Uncharacterized protein n=1 Tax=Prunus armeniaca TaxID=36596 RepID=A0A6J5Y6E3_PRUAR|nr:unnamed protein product [Prunus armeniaca]
MAPLQPHLLCSLTVSSLLLLLEHGKVENRHLHEMLEQDLKYCKSIKAFIVSGRLVPANDVLATLYSLPDKVVDTVGITSLPSEDSIFERRRKLDFLHMQEELMKISIGALGSCRTKLANLRRKREKEEQAKMKEIKASEEDLALKEMIIPTAKEAREQARARTLEKEEKICEISCALAVLASASSVSREREAFLRLVNLEIELYNGMVEKEGTDGEKDALKAYKVAHDESDSTSVEAEGDEVSSALIDKVDAMLQNLETEIDYICAYW